VLADKEAAGVISVAGDRLHPADLGRLRGKCPARIARGLESRDFHGR